MKEKPYNANFLIALGKRIKDLRKEKGISQFQLAHQADIDRSQIQRIEYGQVNPKICTLVAIAEVLEIKVQELLNFEYSARKRK